MKTINGSQVGTGGYVADSEFTTDGGVIVGTGAGTYQEETGATLRTSLGLAIGTDVLAEQTVGIADDNLVETDSSSVTNGEYAKFTANGLESKSFSEVRSDLNVEDGATAGGAIDTVFSRTGAVVAAASDYDITQIDFAATARIAGRKTAGAGLAEELTAADVLTMIGVASGADVTGSNTCDTPGGAGTDTTAIHDNVTGEISAITEKASPHNDDLLVIEDSEASNAKKRVKISNLPTSGGTVDTSGSPVDNDFAKFTDSNTIEGRSYSITSFSLFNSSS